MKTQKTTLCSLGALFMLLLTINASGQSGLKIGDFLIWKLQDAQISLKLSLLKDIDQAEAQKLNGGNDAQTTPVNAFLIKTPQHVVLVDAGIGKSEEADSGHLIEQMKVTGTDPSEVDLILITHFHFDHIGGLTSPDGKRLFPNATVRASKAESDFWLRDQSLIPADLRDRATKIKAILEPYIQAKTYLPLSSEENPGDGIKAFPGYGHTAGHTVYSFTSKGKEFWCIGDLIHFGDIQFKLPEVAVVFDKDSKQAVDSRIAFFNRAAENHIPIGGSHLPEILMLEKSGDSFVPKPVKGE